MPDTETRTMNIAEIALMREIVKWRRNHGGKLIYNLAARRGGPVGIEKASSEAITWLPSRVDTYRMTEIGWCEFNDLMPWIWYKVRTVTQAVDVLVAIGFLPSRFSSSYRAGWNASALWHGEIREDDEAEFKRLFHDPSNISFPAVPEAEQA
jgi:hypothetical protein